MQYIMVMCAAGTKENGAQIASKLVHDKLAACVQMIPIESYYRWEGEVQHEPENLLLIKSESLLFEKIKTCILEIHTYALPEISWVPISGGSTEYLQWISDSVSDSEIETS